MVSNARIDWNTIAEIFSDDYLTSCLSREGEFEIEGERKTVVDRSLGIRSCTAQR